MKAKIIALALSLCVSALPLTAFSAPPSITVNNKIDLNKVDAKALTGSFRGIGKKRAEAIIAYRDSHHGFKAIEELAEVKGFGQKFLDTNKDKLKEVFVIN